MNSPRDSLWDEYCHKKILFFGKKIGYKKVNEKVVLKLVNKTVYLSIITHFGTYLDKFVEG